MRNLFIIPLVLISLSFATPSYASSLLCGTVGIGCEKIDWSEVVLINGYVYKKFATEKFTGEVTGQEQYKVVTGLKRRKIPWFSRLRCTLVRGVTMKMVKNWSMEQLL